MSDKTAHAVLRETQRDAVEGYWRAITQGGWSAEHKATSMERLCAAALRLHLFEQGFSAAKREGSKR